MNIPGEFLFGRTEVLREAGRSSDLQRTARTEDHERVFQPPAASLLLILVAYLGPAKARCKRKTIR